MRALLDTHVFITAAEEVSKLSDAARRVLEDVNTERWLSAISLTEMAVKASIGKLRKLSPEDFSRAAADMDVTVIPYETRHAMQLLELPLHHRDPFDRMLIATALAEGVPIISADRQFMRYRGLSVIW